MEPAVPCVELMRNLLFSQTRFQKKGEGKTMQFDIMHFEALGAESQHLEEATKEAQAKGLLPKD